MNPANQTLSLDLINTFPELNSSVIKADFGVVRVCVEDEQGQFTQIATLDYSQYNQQAYELQAGIVDIQLGADHIEMLEQGNLAFYVTQKQNQINVPVRVLKEEVYTASSDDRAFYIEQSERNKKLTIQVLYKGQPAPGGTKLLLAQYDNGNTDTPLLIPGSSITYNICNLTKTASSFVDVYTGTVVETDAEGIVTLLVNPLQQGCCNISLIPFAEDQTQPCISPKLNVTSANYITVRVMPFDDYLADPSQTPDSILTWDFMYNHIFKVYNLIYPVMSQIIPMNNRLRVEGATMQIRATIGEDIQRNGEIYNTMWKSTMYMSITRDLSYGKRQLLRRWCDLVERDMQP